MPDDDLPPLTEELGKAVIQTELHGESLYKHDEAPGGEKESTSGDGQTVAGVEPTDAIQRSDAQRHNFSLVCGRVIHTRGVVQHCSLSASTLNIFVLSQSQ